MKTKMGVPQYKYKEAIFLFCFSVIMYIYCFTGTVPVIG